MSKTPFLLAAVLGSFAFPAVAQQPATGGAVTMSEPGKAGMVSVVKASAKVTAIHKANRVLTLKPAKGEAFDVEAGPEVKNFAQIKVGDEVVVAYFESLTLELKKKGSSVTERTDTEGAVGAKLGERPAGAVGRQVTVTANVTAVDPVAKTITLKGPKHSLTLPVKNQDQFKVVKVGDQVEAVYTEAVAVSVEPATPAAPVKK